MKTKYLDTHRKLMFCKEFLIKQFNKNGYTPGSADIDKHLKDIDLYSSLFKKECNVKPNSKLDTDKANKYIYLIYNDLTILYSLLEDLAVKKYNNLKEYIDCNLHELNALTSLYVNRSKLELNSSFLGKTIFYQDNNFPKYVKSFSLGNITLHAGSAIACIISGTNLQNDQIGFTFENINEILYTGPYNFNNNILQIPGNFKRNIYNIKLKIGTTNEFIDLNKNNDIDVNINNQYTAFNGTNKIKVSDKITGEIYYKDISDDYTVYIPNNSYISFYTKDSCNLNFSYSSKPLYTNFEGISVNDNIGRKQFIIECPDNFILSINADDNVYANKKQCIVDDNKIMFPEQTKLNDFILEETLEGEEKEYNLTLNVLNDNYAIDYIAIKELIKNGDD